MHIFNPALGVKEAGTPPPLTPLRPRTLVPGAAGPELPGSSLLPRRSSVQARVRPGPRPHCPRTREAAAPAAAPDAAAAAAATPPSVLLSGGHGPTAPQDTPFPQGGRPLLHFFLGGGAAAAAAGAPPAHRRQRGPLHVHGAAGGGTSGPATARGDPGRARPSQGLQLPGVRPCLCQPSAAAEPPCVALGPQALYVRCLWQGLQAFQPPVAAPRHAPRARWPAAHLPALPAPLPGRRGAGAARAPALSSALPSGPPRLTHTASLPHLPGFCRGDCLTRGLGFLTYRQKEPSFCPSPPV